ncbi:hypothetical protein [Streptomyces sporangiiformans]|uniref:DUF4034 domain-containing protein n=1 Tax=Streptomyces sporangiiformans TaxID=2315329 RepID=A0A505D5Z7_9ACTN|nr:hypothetical protein [Streptomyces sporangiiformans]TPQ19194.1 hypothetical protein FGD71_027015 [Streptomyces sporangiiformans]
MLRRRPSLLIRPELDDRALHVTLTELRPAQQLHGLGAGRTRPLWEPVAALLRATGRDWDRRVHRISVLAGSLPPAVPQRWIADRPDDADALVLQAFALSERAPAEGRAAAHRAEQACLRAARACPEDPTPWLALLSLLDAFAAPARYAVPVWTEAVDRAPWNRTAYHRLLRYLSPRGHGTVPDMMDFAEQGAARAPYGSPLVLLPVAARVELVAHRLRQDPLAAVGAGGHWHEPRAAVEVDAALTGWFHTPAAPHAEAVADLNVLAFALTRIRRPAEAAAVFHRIGRHMTHHPWDLLPDPEGTFRYWRDRSDDRHPT